MILSPVVLPTLVHLERKLRDNIRHAKLICHGYEDTRECTLAWDRVEGIQKAIHKKKEKDIDASLDPQCAFDESACREYDV